MFFTFFINFFYFLKHVQAHCNHVSHEPENWRRNKARLLRHSSSLRCDRTGTWTCPVGGTDQAGGWQQALVAETQTGMVGLEEEETRKITEK